MRLSKLSLQGYKTFATKTDFLFDGNITAIVGPNGSGKSNIADAIRWVLGEQSYMTLRGKRTTDMIFSGGRNRSRAGMAQAILTLDNTNGWLPLDYIEIEIGRRAYRSGENEYILNGQRVRLKDVSELLANSGLAERTYTIIGQGLVDQALSLRPQERRALFEEAAGIGLYKTKRAETVRRLDETRLNLGRVTDILTELTPRLRQLKRQANRTRNYAQVESDLRYLLRIWYGYQWNLEQRELQISREISGTAEENWRSGRSKTLDLRKKIEELRQELQVSRERIAEIELQRESIRDSLGIARQEVAVAMERKSILVQQENSLKKRIALLDTGLHEAERKLNEAQEEAAAAFSEQEDVERMLERFQLDQGADESAILRLESKISILNDELRSTDNDLARADGRSIQIDERLAELTASKKVDSQLLAADEQRQKADNELQRLIDSLADVKAKRIELSKKLEELRIELAAHLAEFDRLQLTKIDLRETISKQEAKIEVHERQLAAKSDVPETINIAGHLMDFVSVRSEYRDALLSALAYALDTSVVESEDDLWRLVRLSQQEGTDISITSPGSIYNESKPIEHPEIRSRLSSLIEVKGELLTTVKKLLDNVYLVDDGPTALAIIDDFPPGTVLVSIDGLIIRSGRLVQNLPHSIDLSNYQTVNELKNLKEQTASNTYEMGQLEQQIAGLSASLELIQNEIRDLEATLAKVEKEEQLLDSRVAKSQAEYERRQEEFERVSKEFAQTEATLSNLLDRKENIQRDINELIEKKEDIRLKIVNSEEELSKLPVKETKQERLLLEQRLQSARTIAAGRVAVVDSRRTTLEQVQEQLKRAIQDRQDLQDQRLSLNLASLEDKVVDLEEKYSETANRLVPARLNQDLLQKDLRQLEQQLDKQQSINDGLEAAYTQARIKSSQQENNVQGLKERIQAELGIVNLPSENSNVQTPLPMSDIVEVLPAVEELPEDIESSIQRLRGQLNRIGAINPDAPIEHLELQDRFDFLQDQVADLDATSQRLQEIIQELDELTSKSFVETVGRVDKEFRKVFTRLFGGGIAQLVLTDPDELAISGVDIVARLPGRRALNLGLLSGGERALTAAALVFSLLIVSPTPFCVLDEVDAMLDEANITRFRDMLSELSQQTQFVVITHNRGTIQVADNVYGISMGPDSSSQVISIKPETYISTSSQR
ncbi:MAG: chromosome segregation protein SMC [Anaerolineae bacterium]|nr:MAG: chromosome segregation protein SMC [Anaerolineae bacterium]